jgi:deazaflavin-dependent oxidoreductase (nitroreductase family)
VTRAQRLRRRLILAWWRLINPLSRPLAGIAPWWVLLETTGRRSGKPRHIPLARGPIDGNVAWLLAVHGEHAGFAHNIAADPRVRLKHRGRWREGRAALVPLDPAIVRRFNLYARSGLLGAVAIDATMVRVELE